MKNKLKTFSRLIHALIIIALLTTTGCLGGGGGGGLASIVGGGIGGTGVSLGPVSGFGSVILNGVTFNTSGTNFTVNGAPAIESDIQVGQIVRAEVDFNDETASQIEYAETVRGPIQVIDLVARTMTVLNQQIIVNDTTSFFNNVLFENLIVGNELEISGTRTSTGQIVASYIRLRTGTSEYRVIGQISNVTLTTFEVVGPAPNLIVDFSAANQMGLSAALANGQIIEARGMVANFNAGTNTFIVDEIKDGLDLDADVDDQVEFEGIITTFSALSNFVVNGQVIDGSSASIVFEDGTAATVGDLGVNVKVEVEGTIQSSNVLSATRIVIKPDSNIRITSTVDSVDTTAQTLTMLGEVINVSSLTRFEDDSAIGLTQFGLANIMPGNYVEMRGSIIGSNIVASRINREDLDTQVELQGPVDAVDGILMTVTILGNTLVIDGSTTFQDENDMAYPSAAAFFAAISVGSIVKAEWDPFSAITDPVDEFEVEEL